MAVYLLDEDLWFPPPSGIGTKSQQALKLQQEENKLERKVLSKEMKEAEKQRQFVLKQEKRKKKHRGH